MTSLNNYALESMTPYEEDIYYDILFFRNQAQHTLDPYELEESYQELGFELSHYPDTPQLQELFRLLGDIRADYWANEALA